MGVGTKQNMSEPVFPYDVFLSHSAKDKAVVRPLPERLRKDLVKVPFQSGFRNSDFGFAQPGMSANAFGSDGAQLATPAVASERRGKSGTFRFRDPLNKERRLLPLRLGDAPGTFTDLQAHRITLNN